MILCYFVYESMFTKSSLFVCDRFCNGEAELTEACQLGQCKEATNNLDSCCIRSLLLLLHSRLMAKWWRFCG